MKTGPVGEKCACGADDWTITETMIECRACRQLWGRVNDVWVRVDPKREGNFCPEDVCPLCYHRLVDPAHAVCREERAVKK